MSYYKIIQDYYNRIIKGLEDKVSQLEVKEINCKVALKEIAYARDIYFSNYPDLIVKLIGTDDYKRALRLYLKINKYQSYRIAYEYLIIEIKSKC